MIDFCSKDSVTGETCSDAFDKLVSFDNRYKDWEPYQCELSKL